MTKKFGTETFHDRDENPVARITGTKSGYRVHRLATSINGIVQSTGYKSYGTLRGARVAANNIKQASNRKLRTPPLPDETTVIIEANFSSITSDSDLKEVVLRACEELRREGCVEKVLVEKPERTVPASTEDWTDEL